MKNYVSELAVSGVSPAAVRTDVWRRHQRPHLLLHLFFCSRACYGEKKICATPQQKKKRSEGNFGGGGAIEEEEEEEEEEAPGKIRVGGKKATEEKRRRVFFK